MVNKKLNEIEVFYQEEIIRVFKNCTGKKTRDKNIINKTKGNKKEDFYILNKNGIFANN